MVEQFKWRLEADLARWEDAIASRRDWVRQGLVSAELVQQEIEWFEGRAVNSRFLVALC
jgi:hypothetical protein